MTTETIRFSVIGHPQAKGSKRALPAGGRAGGRPILVDSNKNAPSWQREVRSAAAYAMNGRPLIRGPVGVQLTFCFARPRGHLGTGRNAAQLRPSAPAHMTTMPDVDKLARCVLDGLIGAVLHDDSLVVALHAAKVYGEPERVEVRVRELE